MLGPGIGVPESPFSFSSRVDAALFFLFLYQNRCRSSAGEKKRDGQSSD
jgi:hypothetical protein